MTSNQIAYQANRIKQQEADIKAAKQKLETSEHLYEYGGIRTPMRDSEISYGGTDLGFKFIDTAAKAAKAFGDIAKGASLIAA